MKDNNTPEVGSVVHSKLPYTVPKLIKYGSVRNLTGGSGGTKSDGHGTRTRASKRF